MKTAPEEIGQMSVPMRPQHRTDALAPICDINEQCLQMLVGMARDIPSSAEPFLHQLLPLIARLDANTLTAAARFPFLLVDFGFSDPGWWQTITSEADASADEFTWNAPFPRTTTIKLARATTVLAWHTVRTDAEAAAVLLGITPAVVKTLRSLRLGSIDDVAERHASRLSLRWNNQSAVWRQLFACAQSTEIDVAHEFVLHALQLTARAFSPRRPDQELSISGSRTSLPPGQQQRLASDGQARNSSRY